MKKQILLVLLVLFSTAVLAQEASKEKENKNVKVPEAVSQAFNKDFPGIKNVNWSSEDNEFEAEFKLNGAEASANYDKTGHRTETEIGINGKDLPADAMNYITKNYAAYKISEVNKVTDSKNILSYEVIVTKDGKSTEVLFDSNGKFTKQEKGD
jgi:hypothetical protein